MRNWRILGKSIILVLIIFIPSQSNYNFQGYNRNQSDELVLKGIGTYGWEKSRPCFQGISQAKVAAIDNYIRQNDLNVDHLLLLKNGFNIAEEVYGSRHHTVEYIVKTVTATAIGLALKNHVLNLSQKVLDFFPELNSTNYHLWTLELTIKHLLTMTAGFNITGGLNYTGNFYHDILKRTMYASPGLEFQYDEYLYTLLAFIADDYLNDVLDSLSIFVELMSITEQGYSLGYGGMTMRIGDIAKLGYVYISNGIWDNSNFITNDWINESLAKQVEINDSLYYGYSWIINEELGCYSSGGFSNSQLFIIPEEKIVLVIMSREYSASYLEDYYFLIENILLNDDYKIILTIAYGFPTLLGIVVLFIVFRRIKKK